ncbi:MAG: hypothetical protein CM15mP117_14420 [Alphaproteobacteria bacterium]|nr:MAG: hypothetical protein CM15mP117_14420 [Alphaproteobacteria bacterium]
MALSDYGNDKFRMSQHYEHIGEIKFVVDDLSKDWKIHRSKKALY